MEGFGKRHSWEICSHCPEIQFEAVMETTDFSQSSHLPRLRIELDAFQIHMCSITTTSLNWITVKWNMNKKALKA
jgi:hypothetical protein